jgi:hypothetical protein
MAISATPPATCAAANAIAASSPMLTSASETGYLVKSLKETVPCQEAQPSPDGHY